MIEYKYSFSVIFRVSDHVNQKMPRQHLSHHLTARFCTSPFLSSSNFKSIWTTWNDPKKKKKGYNCLQVCKGWHWKKTNKQKRKEKRSTLKQGVLGAPGNISFGWVHARITDLSFTVVIQFYRIFLKFSHQVICCHKSEVLVTWCHLNKSQRMTINTSKHAKLNKWC